MAPEQIAGDSDKEPKTKYKQEYSERVGREVCKGEASTKQHRSLHPLVLLLTNGYVGEQSYARIIIYLLLETATLLRLLGQAQPFVCTLNNIRCWYFRCPPIESPPGLEHQAGSPL